MKKARKKLTAILNAVTFAEAGEHETAIDFLDRRAPESETGASVAEQSSDSAGVHEKGLLRRLGDHMAAAAFAEAGEIETAREMLQIRPRPKAVLLVLDGDLVDFDAFTYAVNLCKRVKAAMEIVAFSPGTEVGGTEKDSSARRTVSEQMASLQVLADKGGISCTVTVHAGTVGNDLFPYVRSHKQIAAVIYASQIPHHQAGKEFPLHRALESIVARLAIPLVMVLGRRPVRAHS